MKRGLAKLGDKYPVFDPNNIPPRNLLTHKPHIVSAGFGGMVPSRRLWVCKGRGAVGADISPSLAYRDWESQELLC